MASLIGKETSVIHRKDRQNAEKENFKIISVIRVLCGEIKIKLDSNHLYFYLIPGYFI